MKIEASNPAPSTMLMMSRGPTEEKKIDELPQKKLRAYQNETLLEAMVFLPILSKFSLVCLKLRSEVSILCRKIIRVTLQLGTCFKDMMKG